MTRRKIDPLRPLTPAEHARLEQVQRRLRESNPRWGSRLEAAYVPLDVLRVDVPPKALQLENAAPTAAPV